MRRKKVIVLVSSITFYKQVIAIKHELESLGLKVIVPKLASQMEKSGDYRLKSYMDTFYQGDFIKGKGRAIREHFQQIEVSDAILVVNNTKHAVKGYIGPNVLMEMAIAFHLKLPIFIYNSTPKKFPFSDEISAMQPIFIQQNIKKIAKKLK